MNKQRIAVLFIAALGLLATFMPWATLPILGAMNGTDNSLGWVSLSFFAIPMVVSLIGNKNNELHRTPLVLVIVASVLAVIACLIQVFIFNTLDRKDSLLDAMISEQLSIGFGFYIAIFAGVILPVFALLMRDSKISKRQAEALRNYKKKTAKKAKEPKAKIVEEVAEKVERPKAEEVENKIDKEDHSRFMPS